MKLKFLIWFTLLASASFAQVRYAGFHEIDWRVRNVDARTPDTLAEKLTLPFTTDLEKVRAIFTWTTKNIAYNTGIFTYSRKNRNTSFPFDPTDTISVWKSAHEMTALRVLHRRVAVCDGYAKLFKTLCDYAGIPCEVISGYAKCHVEKNEKFRTNHTWNAVMIDGKWYLLDVTWASGYVNYANQFVQQTDESYFLPDPERFIRDHYPDDLRWTLLERPPVLREFHFSPYKCKSFVKYTLQVPASSNGIIEAEEGDTVTIELPVKDHGRDTSIAPDPNLDSAIFFTTPASAFIEPQIRENTAVYRFAADERFPWIHLMYNGDVVLRYRLQIKKRDRPQD